jgi:hypothetical protein
VIHNDTRSTKYQTHINHWVKRIFQHPFKINYMLLHRWQRCWMNHKQGLNKVRILTLRMWPASWFGGQNFWLLAMRSQVWFSVLPWEFSPAGEEPHSLYNLGLRPFRVLHAHTYHHSHHRGNVTAPYGRPNLGIRLHFGHNHEGRTTKSTGWGISPLPPFVNRKAWGIDG